MGHRTPARSRTQKAPRKTVRRVRPRPAATQPSLSNVRPGRPIYRDAGTGRRTESFYAPETGPLSSIIANGTILRARARALMRQNAWARNARETFAANAIGTGIVP